MAPTEYIRTLTKTDVGAPSDDGAKSNQSGFLVRVPYRKLFGDLDESAPNPKLPVTIRDWTGMEWQLEFALYNRYTKPNKREFRLLQVAEFQRLYGIGIGTTLRFVRSVSTISVEILVPGEDDPDVERPSESSGLPEGAKSTVTVNRYERSRRNRKACLDHHGLRCACCEMTFAEAYGAAAASIIHVHHVIPISELGDGYAIDPIRDLRPVCPNCHAVIHQAGGGSMVSISEVRALRDLAPDE